MKERALKLAARLEEIGQVKDMGRPPVNDTERESAALIREMQSRLEELNQKVDDLEKAAQLIRVRAISDCAELLSKQHTWITNIAASTLVMNIDTAMQANKGE